MKVTGPSLASSTDIMAPKRPVSTGTPGARTAATSLSKKDAALFGWGGIGERGAAAFGGFGGDGEIADEENAAGDLVDVEVEAFVVVVLEDAQAGELGGGPHDVGISVGSFDGGEDQHAA